MKLVSTLILIFALSNQLFSQRLLKEDVLGSWKVVGSQLLPEMIIDLDAEGHKKMEQMRDGFIGTTFQFKENNDFLIKFPENTTGFMTELEFSNNSKWKIEKGEKIDIGSEKDNYSLMSLKVINAQGKKYFNLYETPFILEVVRL
jgi:hypothetical protein